MKQIPLMRHFSCLFFLLVFANTATAQITFRKSYGTSVGQTLPHPDGGFISISYQGLMRTSATGNVIWAKDIASFYARSIDFTPGGYILSGTYNINMTTTIGALIKTDTSGNIIWGKKMIRPSGGAYLPSTARSTSDGGYIVCGQYGGKAFVVKTDASGDTTWTKLFPFPDFSWGGLNCSNARELASGGYAASGYCLTNTGYDPFLIRFDANGDTLWTRFYHSQVEGSNEGNFRQLSDGGFMVMGGSSNGAFHIRTDSMGIPIWAKSYGLPNNPGDASTAMVETGTGQYSFLGFSHTFSFSGSGQPEFFQTDTSGNVVNWAYIYDLDSTGGKELSRDLRRTPDGGYVFGSNGLPGMVKTDINGKAGCTYDTLNLQITNETITLWSGSTVLHTNKHDNETFIITPQTLTPYTFCEYPGWIKSIEETNINNDFLLYPNPANEILTIEFRQPQNGNEQFTLTTIAGQIISLPPALHQENKISFSTQTIAAGFYFLRIEANSKPITLPVIITH